MLQREKLPCMLYNAFNLFLGHMNRVSFPRDSPPGNCARIEVNGGENEDRNLQAFSAAGNGASGDSFPLWNYKGRIEILAKSISSPFRPIATRRPRPRVSTSLPNW